MAGPWTLLLVAALAGGRVGSVDFFGYGGLDLNELRAALPLHAGEALTRHSERDLEKAAGHGAQVAFICCDERGGYYVFIGLEGKTARRVRFLPDPVGNSRLPEPGMALYEKAMSLIFDAVRQNQAGEDSSQGYALDAYPPLRRVQMEMRDYARSHARELCDVVASSASREQRRAAAHLLGYAVESTEQVAALVAAAHDIDETVRNNAIRALGVLAKHDPATARKIPAAPFVDLLLSMTWTDRNKALMLLAELTATRDPETLLLLRREALGALAEMAQWSSSYRLLPRLLLGRMAGIPEERLAALAVAADPAPILAAVRALPPL